MLLSNQETIKLANRLVCAMASNNDLVCRLSVPFQVLYSMVDEAFLCRVHRKGGGHEQGGGNLGWRLTETDTDTHTEREREVVNLDDFQRKPINEKFVKSLVNCVNIFNITWHWHPSIW